MHGIDVILPALNSELVSSANGFFSFSCEVVKGWHFSYFKMITICGKDLLLPQLAPY